MKLADIDIDTKPDFDPTKIFKDWVRASNVLDDQLKPHPVGVHPQAIARDELTGLSAIPYEEAENLGYYKIDFLHLSAYSVFNSHEEIEELLKIEPDWSLLLDQNVQKKLFQLSRHGEILEAVEPRSIEELADVLALIRPGKKDFLGLYLKDQAATRKILYSKDETGYSFKKSHAIAYAMVVVLQLHLAAINLL